MITYLSTHHKVPRSISPSTYKFISNDQSSSFLHYSKPDKRILLIFHPIDPFKQFLLFTAQLAMELSVDEKIEAAIQPLLTRIAALEADNQKIKTELAAIHAAPHPKPPHKPIAKPAPEPVDRPQTYKGRRKSVDHNDSKTDKKIYGKKEEVKGDQEEPKNDSQKLIDGKSPVIGGKVAPSPVIHKDGNKNLDPKNAKDSKVRPTTAGRERVHSKEARVADRKAPVPRFGENEHEKKEDGLEKIEEKRQISHEKTEHKNNNAKVPSTNHLKSPLHSNKVKANEKTVDKKAVPQPVPVVKGKGKVLVPGPKEVKTETKAEDVKDDSQLLGNHEKKQAENKQANPVPEVAKGEEKVESPEEGHTQNAESAEVLDTENEHEENNVPSETD